MKKEFKAKKSEGGSGGGSLVPEGDYKLKIHGDEWKETTAKDGHYLAVEFVGADKASGKRHFWHNFNLDNPSEKAVEISEEQLENLLFCCGVEKLKFKKEPTAKELHGMEVMAHITIEEVDKKQKKKGYKPKNRIQYFFEVEEGGGKKKDKKKKKEIPF